MQAEIIRAPAEARCQDELQRLKAWDKYPRPAGWSLSPRAVEKFILGDAELNIKPKYIGDRDRIQVAIATLASDRALLLVGEPGTAKSWVSNTSAQPSAATRNSPYRALRAQPKTRLNIRGTTRC